MFKMKETLSIYKNPDDIMNNSNVANCNVTTNHSMDAKIVTAIVYGVIHACDDGFTGEKAAYDAVMQLLDSEYWAKLAARLVLHYMIHETDKHVIVQSISREIAQISNRARPLPGPQVTSQSARYGTQHTSVESHPTQIQYRTQTTDHDSQIGCNQSTIEPPSYQSQQTTQYRTQHPTHQTYDYFAAQDQYQRCMTHYAQQVQHNLAQRREAMDMLNYGSSLSRRSRGL